jgi:hypothetical protein
LAVSYVPCEEANMDSLPLFKKVHEQLRRHGLPAAYIKRFMEELADALCLSRICNW